MPTSKREEFLSGANRYRGPNRVVLLVFALAAVVGVGAFFLATRDNTPVRRWEGGTYNIGQTPNYKGRTISMTDIESRVVDGKIEFPLQAVIDNSIVYTPIPSNKEVKALMAYISPAGRLVVATAMCEPCRSQRFHIEGNVLVCDTCGTRWYLNDLQGISGGCPQYPPEEVPYTVENGTVKVDTKILDQWQPRTVIGTQVPSQSQK